MIDRLCISLDSSMAPDYKAVHACTCTTAWCCCTETVSSSTWLCQACSFSSRFMQSCSFLRDSCSLKRCPSTLFNTCMYMTKVSALSAASQQPAPVTTAVVAAPVTISSDVSCADACPAWHARKVLEGYKLLVKYRLADGQYHTSAST